MADFEALYEMRCQTPLCWAELYEKQIVRRNLVRETKDKVKMICQRLKATSDRQKSYADLKQRDVEY